MNANQDGKPNEFRHDKVIGVLFIVLASLLFVVGLVYTLMTLVFAFLMMTTDAQTTSIVYTALIFFALIFVVILCGTLYMLTGIKLIRVSPNCRLFGIISGISLIPVALASVTVFPIGTLMGFFELAFAVYSLWFFFGSKGKLL